MVAVLSSPTVVLISPPRYMPPLCQQHWCSNLYYHWQCWERLLSKNRPMQHASSYSTTTPFPCIKGETNYNWFPPEWIFWTHSATQFPCLLSPVHLQQVMFEHKHATNCPIIFILWYVQFHSKNKLFNYAWITTGSWVVKRLSHYRSATQRQIHDYY